ncbi:glycosyltransferase [bacterium]|jgi:glycosyltransferase involved in cell wall biosynthesis|nr:glycosyltransferase [bacterium]
MIDKIDSNDDLVSIVIPCYNYESYVEKCIESALNQTYENIEVIIIDNGSTDGSFSKIQRFSNNNKVRIFRFENNSPPGSKDYVVSYGIRKSKGKYISILMADDWYLPEKIEKQIKLFSILPNSVGLVYCHGYTYLDDSNELKKWKMGSISGYVFKEYLSNGDIVIPISPLIKRYCYDIIGVDNDWIGSEYDYFVMSQYVDFDYVDEHLVVMRVHDKNDRFNYLSVYERVKRYDNKALTTGSAIARGGRLLINKRRAAKYITFAFDFIVIMRDMENGFLAIQEGVKFFPFYLIRPKVLAALVLIIMPVKISNFILNKYAN